MLYKATTQQLMIRRMRPSEGFQQGCTKCRIIFCKVYRMDNRLKGVKGRRWWWWQGMHIRSTVVYNQGEMGTPTKMVAGKMKRSGSNRKLIWRNKVSDERLQGCCKKEACNPFNLYKKRPRRSLYLSLRLSFYVEGRLALLVFEMARLVHVVGGYWLMLGGMKF